MTDQPSPTATGLARQALGELRPQTFAAKPSSNVVDPIVEPLWTGVRVLAAVDTFGVALVDEKGVEVTGFDDIIEALAIAAPDDEIVVDGIITKQATRTADAVVAWSDEMPSMGTMLGLRRNRAVDTLKLKEGSLADQTFQPDDAIAFVVTDLLWLGESSLFDIPLLERRRLLEAVVIESDAVRIGAFVRPPIDRWVASWRAQGFSGLTFKAANSRYVPGSANPDWVITGMPRR